MNIKLTKEQDDVVNFASTKHNMCIFGKAGVGKTTVVESMQLGPVPSPLDPGNSIIFSKLFDKVFPHRFELQRVLRQGEDEEKLKNALDLIRVGKCNDEVEQYLQSLARDLNSSNVPSEKIHIYFKKLPAEIHNLGALAEIPGELTIFESKDTGNARSLEKTVSQSLTVKPGCKVMFLYNINDDLKNGYKGEYVGINEDEEHLIVNFPKVGNVPIARRTWYKFDTNGRIQGSRTQFPLAPCYAITVHKAQSTTLERVVVHCSQEFVPGQTYVALSRVTREASLQVFGFRRSFLLPPPPELSDFDLNKMGIMDQYFGCCSGMHLEENFFECDQECETDLAEEMDNLVQHNDFTSAASSYFESNSGAVINLGDVLLCMSDFSNELSKPPSSFSVKAFLEKIINDANEDSYSQSVKSAAKYGTHNLDDFELLACLFWYRIF
ncbi:ATP-dependent DNA helicase PIF1-like [Dendronephthya gigantea]|uniref:ATP-dependent DNA helicase PIF1-like n=1 Tax=Dendronephthya gigantea TaxID=151771 RepID=UPI00106BE53F|nr:ATP-dependent DNA helicase PIF1-like [Dendronephthya gigantea]